LGELERALLSMAELIKDALAGVPDESSEDQSVREAELALVRLSELAAVCARYRSFDEEPNEIFWLERRKTSQGEGFAQLMITPLDISFMMNEAVFDQFRTVACLSATLSIGGSFGFWKNRVGLSASGARVECREYPSPFPFERNALLAATSDAPDPSSPSGKLGSTTPSTS
ncbi:MAG TPA: hypothetical protein PLW80_09900, partial [Spirochaetales bacterium]|nr:hypothetical protein [Spirochaetales bacterium]